MNDMRNTIIFDIETVGEDFDGMDEVTRQEFTKRLRDSASSDEEYATLLAEAKGKMALSPLTGEIVALGIMDSDTGEGAVYYQSPGQRQEEAAVGGVKLVVMTEEEMLRQFWRLIEHARVIVGFNSRSFDAWWLSVRSAVHGIRPSVDLLEGRYLHQQRGAKHVDLLDQLTGYGAARGGSLHMWCRVFGIKSPKVSGMSGGEVGKAFAEGRFLDIARYNVDDLVAERELFLRWNQYLNFQKL